MKTDGEPDTYVKTVLTFRDKPAPAMAQIAVEKNGRRRRKPEPSRRENIEEQQLHGRYTGFHSHCTTGSRADDRN